jgi:ABC-2 type transport system permease protein
VSAFVPAPAPAPLGRMVLAQAGLELRLTLRRGESVLLTLVVPLVLLAGIASAEVDDVGVDFLVPGIMALAVMSTAFTGLAIATGYERSYGVLKRLGATPLSRPALLAGKTLALFGVEVLQVAAIVGVGLALGWEPHGSPVAVLVLLLAGTAAFCGLGLLMAGSLRAEATLAGANAVYLVLLLLAGVVFPVDRLPGPVAAVAGVLPTTALADGLRQVLAAGAALPVGDLALLLGWALAAGAAATATFRWE